MSPSPRESSATGPLFALLVAAAVCLVYRAALGAEFLDWDDRVNLLAHADWRGLSFEHLKWMFETPYNGPYQPLSWITLAVDHALWGLDPLGFHLTNMLFHAATAAAFFFLARTFLRVVLPATRELDVDLAALAAALLFGLHPLRVESVAWVTERRDVVSGLFYVLTLLFWVRHAARGDARWGRDAWLAFACCLLALLGKGTGMFLPFALFVLDVFPLRRWRRVGGPHSARTLILEKLPLLVLGLVFARIAWWGQAQLEHTMSTLESIGVAPRVMQALYSAVYFVRATIWPIDTSPFHPYQIQPDALDPRFLTALAVIAVGLPLLLVLRARAVLAACAAYLVIALPILGLAQTGPQLVADRYSYLPCMPFALLFGAGIAYAIGRWPRARTALVSASLAACAALGLASWTLVPVWHDDVTLWRRVVRMYPDTEIAWRKLSVVTTQRAETRTLPAEKHALLLETIEVCRTGLDHVRDPALPNNALRAYDLLAELEPEHAGQFLDTQIGLAQQAVELNATALKPVPEAEVNLGLLYCRLDRWEDARAVFEPLAEREPGNLSAQLMLGQVLNRLNRPRDALLRLQHVVDVQPENSAAWFDIGEAHKALAEQAQAMAAFRKVIEIKRRLPPSDDGELEAAQSELQLLESQAPRAPGG